MADIYCVTPPTTTQAQISTMVVGGTLETTDKFNVTRTGEDASTFQISTVGGSATISTAITTIVTALNASTHRLFRDITFAAASPNITATADTAGVPFTISVVSVETDDSPQDSQTFTVSTTQANIGPGDAANTANFSTGAVPVTSDTLTLDSRMGTGGLLYNLNYSSVTLAALNHYKSAYAVGSLTGVFRISATIARLGLPSQDGSSASGAQVNIDFGANACTCEVYDSASTGTGGFAPTLITGNHAGNLLTVYKGKVGLGTFLPGTSGQWPTVQVIGNQAELEIGAGTTVANLLHIAGGKVKTNAAIPTATLLSGEWHTEGTGLLGAVTVEGGTLLMNSRASGNDITTLTLDGSGVVDLRGDSAAVTIGTLTIKRGGTIKVASASQLTLSAITIDDTLGVQNFKIEVG
jgi:hypothetical protein